ncbi:MAG: zf-HC2 domain-containing protein [Actinomycetota bacterium]
MSDKPACRVIRELAPELALGVTTGDERARALAHLSECGRCRRLLDELSDVADELLLMVPAREPPLGFESRVVEHLYEARRGRSWRLAVAAVAAALVLASASAGAVLWATSGDRELAARYRRTLAVADGEYFSAIPLYDGRREAVGHVFGYQGSPSWIFVTVADPGRSGSYSVKVVTEAGPSRELGTIVLRDGTGSWGGTLPGDLHDLEYVRLGGEGRQRLEAEL